jgi:hypothetical protein
MTNKSLPEIESYKPPLGVSEEPLLYSAKQLEEFAKAYGTACFDTGYNAGCITGSSHPVYL